MLTTLPFALILAIYGAGMGATALGAPEFVLTLFTLAPAVTLSFATLAWCFALLAFGMVRLTRSLRAERARAEEANRVKPQVLASKSHEIGTPLNGMLGRTRRLEDRNRSPDERARPGGVRQGGEDLLGGLNDVLDLSKVEAGRLELDPQPVRRTDLQAAVFRHAPRNRANRPSRSSADLETGRRPAARDRARPGTQPGANRSGRRGVDPHDAVGPDPRRQQRHAHPWAGGRAHRQARWPVDPALGRGHETIERGGDEGMSAGAGHGGTSEHRPRRQSCTRSPSPPDRLSAARQRSPARTARSPVHTP